MKYIMGIDLGTSSVKVVICDLVGKVKGEGQEVYELLSPQSGWAEQSPYIWWESTVVAIKKALSELKDEANMIEGIGLSGQMHSLVSLDKAGNPLKNSIIWADQRSCDEIGLLYEKISKEALTKVTHNVISPGFMAASLLWMKQKEPEIFQQIETVIFPKDYIRYRLTGEIGTDISDASGSGIFDLENYCWPEFLEEVGFPEKIFPDVHGSQEIAGWITEEAARETGLKKNIPVVYGGGDTPMHALGNGLIYPGMLSVNIGTAGQIAGCVSRPCHDAKFRTNTFCLSVPERWMLVGASLNGGIVMNWMKNRILHISGYEQMDEMVSSVPVGCKGLFFLPYLLGERTPHMDPSARGMFFGLNVNHDSSFMMRAVMEGIAYALKDALDVVESVATFEHKMVASGGGSRSQIFLQMQADIFEKEIFCTDVKEEACIGACMTAAVGLGLYPDYVVACNAMIRRGSELYIPKVENSRIYRERFEIFKEIYQKNKELFKKI